MCDRADTVDMDVVAAAVFWVVGEEETPPGTEAPALFVWRTRRLVAWIQGGEASPASNAICAIDLCMCVCVCVCIYMHREIKHAERERYRERERQSLRERLSLSFSP